MSKSKATKERTISITISILVFSFVFTNSITEEAPIVFIAIGVTDSEARALEALLISTYAELQGLSKKGSCD